MRRPRVPRQSQRRLCEIALRVCFGRVFLPSSMSCGRAPPRPSRTRLRLRLGFGFPRLGASTRAAQILGPDFPSGLGTVCYCVLYIAPSLAQDVSCAAKLLGRRRVSITPVHVFDTAQ
eukprot:525570-Alexandrium_andersonii.AAC.1